MRYFYILLLFVITSISYFYGYQKKSEYFLHVSAKSTTIAVENIIWNINGNPTTKKEAFFSLDSIFRDHVIPIAKGKYSKFTINCSSPVGLEDISCYNQNIYVSDSNNKLISNLSHFKVINNGVQTIIDTNIDLPELSIFNKILFAIMHLLPVYLIFGIFFLKGYKKGFKFALWFSIMFVYAMLSYSSINTGMDAIENINVAKNLFSKLPYYSYVEYRGYMWFLILWVINCSAKLFNIDFYYCYAIYGCLLFSIMLNYILPKFAINMGIDKLSFYNIPLLGFSIIFLYGAQFLCPLPDVIPIFFLILGFNLLFDKPTLKKSLLAGFCIAISCLIRSNYCLSFILLIALIFFQSSLSLKNRFIKICLFIIPVFTLLITNQIFKSHSPIVLNDAYLTQAILFKGMTVQKTAPFEIKDNIGSKILKTEQITQAIDLTVPRYLKLIIKYPLDFLRMYTIRLFNGIDIKYSQVYSNMPSNTKIFSLINYILLFFGFRYVFICNNKKQKLSFLIALVLPSLLMVSSFVEPRYFLILSLTLVTLGSLSISLSSLRNVRVIISLCIFVLCCFFVSMSVYSQIT